MIKSLFKSLSLKTKGKVTEHNIVPYNTLSQETLKLVANFYEDDSVSRVMLGKKDMISTKTNGTKEKKRKRLLLDDISNVHRMYLEEHPDNPTEKSKFFQLRPLLGIPVNEQSQKVCKCVYHENVDMLCTSLVNKARFEKLETDYKMVANADSIWKVTVCDIYNEDCIWRKCEKCTPKSIEKLFPFKDTDDIIEYFQWETVMVERNEKKNYRTTKKSDENLHRSRGYYSFRGVTY